MTLLVTTTNNNFVLSMADRRSSVQVGNKFISQDERFNKHIFFGLRDAKGTATFTGVAQWTNRTGKKITTDEFIANSISQSAKAGKGTRQDFADNSY